MKNNAFVGNTGHFDSEIDLACSDASESATFLLSVKWSTSLPGNMQILLLSRSRVGTPVIGSNGLSPIGMDMGPR